jgi:hypothetical protein
VTDSNVRIKLFADDVKMYSVLVGNKSSFNQHIPNIVHKAGVRTRLFLRSFCSEDCRILLKAYVIRPLLESCSLVWSPFTAADENKIKAV